jgi:hypothetical protein
MSGAHKQRGRSPCGDRPVVSRALGFVCFLLCYCISATAASLLLPAPEGRAGWSVGARKVQNRDVASRSGRHVTVAGGNRAWSSASLGSDVAAHPKIRSRCAVRVKIRGAALGKVWRAPSPGLLSPVVRAVPGKPSPEESASGTPLSMKVMMGGSDKSRPWPGRGSRRSEAGDGAVEAATPVATARSRTRPAHPSGGYSLPERARLKMRAVGLIE